MRPPRIKALNASALPTTDPKLVEQLNSVLTDIGSPSSPSTVYRTVDIQTKTPVSATFPIKVAHGLAGLPVGFTIIGAIDNTDGSVFTVAPFATWIPDSSGENVIIRHITGLTAGHLYRFAVRIERGG